MRVVLLLVLFAATLGSGLVYFTRLDAGYVLFAWAGYSVEMTAWVFVATICVLLFAVWLVSSVLRYSLGLQFHLSRWFGMRGVSQIHNMTARGLAAFEEGHWVRARKLLAKVADQSENALVFYLLCARASHAMGDTDGVSACLQKASAVAPNASMAINLTQAQLQLSDGALEACLATLIRAHAINEAHPTVLKMLAEVYKGLNDWEKLNALLPQLQNERILSAAEFELLRHRCKCELLMLASKQGLEALNTLWKRQTASLRRHQDLVVVYARCLIELKAFDKAEAVLRQSLKENRHDDLVAIYGQLDGVAPEQRFQFISGLLNKEESSVALLLCAGELAILNNLPGQAKQLLERADQKAPNNETRLALLNFYLTNNETAKAAAVLQKMR